MPYPPRITRCPTPLAPHVALLAVLLALAGCGASATTSKDPIATSTPTLAATATPSPTATATSVLCGNTPFPTPASSQPPAVAPFSGWNDVPALPGTLIYSDTARASDGPQTSSSSEALGLCTPSVSPDAVTAFYVARLPANGWTAIATFPPGSACLDLCWMRNLGGSTTGYVALDHLEAADGATFYILTNYDQTTNT